MRGTCSLGRRGVRRLTPYPGRGRGPKRGRGWERFQIRGHVLEGHLIKGLVDQASVSRIDNFLDGPWGDLIGGGRADPGRGHGIVRLRRTSGSNILIGYAGSCYEKGLGLNL